MKVRILSDLKEQKLGQSNLTGKVLTFLDDDVGFFMAQFQLKKDQSLDLLPVFEGHNHIYYCVNGKSTVSITDANQFTLKANTVLALAPSTKTASITANEFSRLLVVSVPALDSQQQNPPYFLSLDDIVGTDRDVDFGAGHSRRFLRKGDGFNISVHSTVFLPNTRLKMQYRNHFEANLLCKGRIEYSWNNNDDTITFDQKDSVTGDGVMCLLDNHDKHQAEAFQVDSHIICVFYPALIGNEKHSFSDTEFSSF